MNSLIDEWNNVKEQQLKTEIKNEIYVRLLTIVMYIILIIGIYFIGYFTYSIFN